MFKLPDDIHLCIAHENWGEAWEMEKLMETVKIEIEAHEASEERRSMWGECLPPKELGEVDIQQQVL